MILVLSVANVTIINWFNLYSALSEFSDHDGLLCEL